MNTFPRFDPYEFLDRDACESANPANLAPAADLDPVVAAIDACPVVIAPADSLPAVWAGLTPAERQDEERRWCKRNGYSHPAGLERLREIEIDDLAMADGWVKP